MSPRRTHTQRERSDESTAWQDKPPALSPRPARAFSPASLVLQRPLFSTRMPSSFGTGHFDPTASETWAAEGGAAVGQGRVEQPPRGGRALHPAHPAPPTADSQQGIHLVRRRLLRTALRSWSRRLSVKSASAVWRRRGRAREPGVCSSRRAGEENTQVARKVRELPRGTTHRASPPAAASARG